jgi:hypothetical protein
MPGITMLEDIEPERIDGVKNPASGFPILMMKAVNASGGVNEKPDISGAEGVLQDIARLIQAEAAEMAVGNWDENYDIQLLSEAACLMACFRSKEMWGDEDDGGDMAKDVKTFLAKRKVSTAERKRLASEGKALSDGSYPIENAEDLKNAAILARSGHGDVAGAKRLIAKRAKELGVANPLADDAKKDAEVETPETETPETPDETVKTSEDTDPQAEGGQEAAPESDAVVKAVESLQGEIESLKGELAKMRATPIPGGPVVSVPPSMRNENTRADQLAKAAYFEGMADKVTEPGLKREYAQRAATAKAAAGVTSS